MSEYTADMIELLTAEPEAEPHIVITRDKTVIVPDVLQKISTQYEKNIETVTFDCPRYWDEHDLSTMHMYINYRRADGVAAPSLCGTPTVDAEDENIVHFAWTIKDHATYVKGKLSFVACAKETDENGELISRWSSRLNQEMEILEGIEPDMGEIIMPSADIIEQLLAKLETAADVATDAAERAIAAAQSATVINKNLLDNWYFVDPVNQRGKTEYTENWAYSIDRWLIPGSALPVIVNDGSVSFGVIDQFTSAILSDGSYTASVLITDGTLYTGTARYTEGSSTVLLGNNGVVDCYMMGDAGVNGHPRIRIQTSGMSLSVIATKLEIGDKQTLAHQDASGAWVLNEIPDKGAELAKCQRYFLPVNHDPFGVGYVQGSANFADILIPVPVSMRITPSVVTDGTFKCRCNGADYDATLSITRQNKANCVEIQLSGEFPARHVAAGFLSGATYMYLDANL